MNLTVIYTVNHKGENRRGKKCVKVVLTNENEMKHMNENVIHCKLGYTTNLSVLLNNYIENSK